MTRPERIHVLFVCMGNICRSPLAEGVFLHKLNRRGVAHRFHVDSCGTGGWHVGDRPDPRALQVATEHGVTLPSRARQIKTADFDRFDSIICMDEENVGILLELGAPREKLRRLLEYDAEATLSDVPDPYYDGPEEFSRVYHLIDSATEALLEAMLRGLK